MFNDGRDIDNATARPINNMSDLLFAFNDNLKLTNYDLKPNDYITRVDTALVKYDADTKETTPYNLSVFDLEAGWKEFEEQIEISQYIKYTDGDLYITPITTAQDLKDYLLSKGSSDVEADFKKWGKLQGTDSFILLRLKEDISFTQVFKSELSNIMETIRN